jgi:hypothetical protein
MQLESMVDVPIGEAASGSVRWTEQAMRPPGSLHPAIRAREAFLASNGRFVAASGRVRFVPKLKTGDSEGSVRGAEREHSSLSNLPQTT